MAVVKQDIADIHQSALFHGGSKQIYLLGIRAHAQRICFCVRIKGRFQRSLAECKIRQPCVVIVFGGGNYADSEQSSGISACTLEFYSNSGSPVLYKVGDVVQIFIEHIVSCIVIYADGLQQLAVDIDFKAAALISGIPGASQIIMLCFRIYRQIIAPPSALVGMTVGAAIKGSHTGISACLEVFRQLRVVVVKAVQVINADFLIPEFFLFLQDPVLGSL